MPIITLTTDFGLKDHYVGVMKGVILGVAPAATVVDITHGIEPQNLHQAAVVLANAATYFPAGTIHVVVVDPGVGTDRRVLLAEAGGHLILMPDNGVLTRLAAVSPPERVTAVMAARFFRPRVSATFHGRDIFAPVAAHLANGLSPGELGPTVDDWVRLEWPEPCGEAGRIEGLVLYADRFGNLITTIDAETAAALGDGARATVAGRTCSLVRTYADAPPGEVVALVGSSDLVEISVVQGSALDALAAGPGTPVTLR